MSAHIFPHQMQPEVLHIRLDLEQSQKKGKGKTKGTLPLTLEEQGDVFDALAAWCDAEQLFIGGSLTNAVVCSPIKPITLQQMQRLRRLIRSQPGIAGCQMKLLLLSYLQSASDKAACLEAFSQAQRYLAEKLAEGADALALLVPAGPRCWAASVTEGGAMLVLQHMRLQISLSLALLDTNEDEEPEAGFDRLDQQIISLKDVETFIPEWLELHWIKVPQHPEAHLSTGRWQAEGHGFQLWITGIPSAQLTHREVMLRWMAAVGAA